MSRMREEWQPVRDGYYEVSSLGRIRRAKPGVNTFPGRILRPSLRSMGYMCAILNIEGKRTDAFVHVLVAEAFIGPRPAGMVINHKDSDKLNNLPYNLEYVTQKQNINAGRIATGKRHGRYTMPERTARGERAGNAVLTENKVRRIRMLGDNGVPLARIANMFSISLSQTHNIVRRKQWKHVV